MRKSTSFDCNLNSFHNLLRNRAVGLDDDLVEVLRGLDGIGLVVDNLELLQSTALRLNAERKQLVIAAVMVMFGV